FSSRRRHTRLVSDWSSDVCSSDLIRKFGTVFIEWKELRYAQVPCLQPGVQGGGLAAPRQRRERERSARRVADWAQRAVPLARRLPQGGSGRLATDGGSPAAAAPSSP